MFFYTYALNVIFAPSPPYPTVFFLHQSKKLLPAILIAGSRRKGLVKLCEIFELSEPI